MAIIKYKVFGSFPPFFVELREGSENGNMINSMVALSADTYYYFTGVSTNNYKLIVYDNAFGEDVSDVKITTTTTTTTTITTTTTTLLSTTTTTSPHTTTTTTTIVPTTTTSTTTVAPIPDILYFSNVSVLPPYTVHNTEAQSFDVKFRLMGGIAATPYTYQIKFETCVVSGPNQPHITLSGGNLGSPVDLYNGSSTVLQSLANSSDIDSFGVIFKLITAGLSGIPMTIKLITTQIGLSISSTLNEGELDYTMDT